MRQLVGVVCLSIFLIAASCEPNYNCYIRNDSSSNLYLRTRPSIESLYDKKSTYYDSIISRYKVREEGTLSVYKVNPNSIFRIYGNIGLTPSLTELPFDYIEVIQGSDTTVLDGKDKILERLKQEGKTRKYFIEK
jgi:hypothetical protein